MPQLCGAKPNRKLKIITAFSVEKSALVKSSRIFYVFFSSIQQFSDIYSGRKEPPSEQGRARK
jgi:hypothetical protein